MALNDYTPVLSTITLPSGSTYYFKDAWAREQLESLVSYSKFLGVTTTELEDGATTNPVTIGGEQVEADSGDIVVYGSKEFIWNGSAWAEFGDLDAIKDLLGDLAYVDEATGEFSITPEGTINATFTGTPKAVNVDGTASGDIDASFSGTAGEVIVNGQVASSEVVVGSTEGTATYRPAGTGTAAYITGTSGANKIVKYSSSRRYKDNIDYEIDKEKYHEDLLKFKPCRFNYKTEPGLTNLGLIAEDVEEINPELCNFEGDKVESFKDRDLLVMCILELQRKDKEINELKSRLESLEAKI